MKRACKLGKYFATLRMTVDVFVMLNLFQHPGCRCFQLCEYVAVPGNNPSSTLQNDGS